jgi:hypothetical protein
MYDRTMASGDHTGGTAPVVDDVHPAPTGGLAAIRAELAEGFAAMTRPAWIAIALSTVIFVVAAVLRVVSVDSLRDFAREDGPVEYLGAFAYLVAGVAIIALAFARPRGRLIMFLLGLGLFFVGGEEISWGQRIFDFGTPDSLESRNVQGETSLHNIDGIHGPVWVIGLAVSAGVFVIWPLARLVVPFLRKLGARLSAPVPSVVPSGIIVSLAVVFYIVQRGLNVGAADHFLGEVAESLLALVALLFAVEAWMAHRGAPIPIFRDDE